MRLKTSGSDGGGRSAWGWGVGVGGSCRAAGATEAPALAEEDEGTCLGLSPPPRWPGREGVCYPTTRRRPRGPRAGGGG